MVYSVLIFIHFNYTAYTIVYIIQLLQLMHFCAHKRVNENK